jgi:hypothetical protein
LFGEGKKKRFAVVLISVYVKKCCFDDYDIYGELNEGISKNFSF